MKGRGKGARDARGGEERLMQERGNMNAACRSGGASVAHARAAPCGTLAPPATSLRFLASHAVCGWKELAQTVNSPSRSAAHLAQRPKHNRLILGDEDECRALERGRGIAWSRGQPTPGQLDEGIH
eukprot:scaffold5543_cov119-Isochrysis_galbana.AAC.5